MHHAAAIMLMHHACCSTTSRLSQKFWVDAWAKVEERNLNFLRFNQDTIRANKYQVYIIP